MSYMELLHTVSSNLPIVAMKMDFIRQCLAAPCNKSENTKLKCNLINSFPSRVGDQNLILAKHSPDELRARRWNIWKWRKWIP